jgi:CheY-like chemotaxis protein
MFGIGKKRDDKNSDKIEEERRFVSELSYNVRNPLNTICGITEITKKVIMNDCDKDTLLSYVDILGDAATELQQTIDTFFDQFETGGFPGQKAADMGDDDANVLNKLRVLVAEDSSVSQLIAREMLESRGAIVTVCDNGAEAVDLFTGSITGTYDVILMDINMPGMDGYEATESIRSSTHPQAGSIPIIAMTAEALPDDVQRAMTAGMNGHISKPINVDKIVAAVRGALG